MANTFFTYLSKHGMMDEWAPALDWYLSNEHFEAEKWKNYISVFTKRIKKIDSLNNIDIKYGPEGSLSFPARRPNSTKVILEQTRRNKDSIGKDFVRHIRNGMAHGRTRFLTIGQKEYIEIKDYKDDLQQKQSAYILAPKECLLEIYKIYSELKVKVEK